MLAMIKGDREAFDDVVDVDEIEARCINLVLCSPRNRLTSIALSLSHLV